MKVFPIATQPSIHPYGRIETQHFEQRANNHVGIDNYNISKEELYEAVDRLNSFNEPTITNLKFVLHEDLHEYYVTVVDPTTNEVVREIPPKKMLDMYVAMVKYMGLLVDEKV